MLLKELSSKEKLFIPWIIAIALFMETLDVTIVSAAIPQIASNFQVSIINVKFALTGYLLSLSIFIPLSGWLADKFGPRTIFAIAISIFISGSILCGLSNNIITMVVARVVQGMGGAFMMPVGRLVLWRTFSKHDLVKINNYIVIPSLIGPAIGPVVGGVILTYMSWPWIFYINIPFGLFGLYLTMQYFNNSKNENTPPFDAIGFFLFSFALVGLSFGFECIDSNILSTTTELTIVLLSLMSLVLCIINSKKRTYPFLDFNLFKIRTFKVTTFGSLCSRFGVGGIPFLLPLFFQSGFNFSPLLSGMLILPLAVGMILMKLFVVMLLKLFGFKKILIVNTILLGLSIIGFCFIRIHTPYSLIVFMIFIHGMLVSLHFSCINILCYVDIDNIMMSKATSIASSIQQLSMGAGVALSALVLQFFIYNTNFNLSISAFQKSFLVIGLITLISSVIFCKLHRSDGHIASAHNVR